MIFIRLWKDLVTHALPNWLNNDVPYGGICNQRIKIDSTNIMALDSQFGRDDLTEKLVQINTKLERASPANLVTKGTAPAVGSVEKIGAHRLHTDDLAQPALETRASKGLEITDPAEETNYIIFYSEPSCPIEDKYGDRISDAMNGVPHYVLGKDRGIIKDIQLEVEQNPSGIEGDAYK